LVLYLPVRAGVGWGPGGGLAHGPGPEISWGVPSSPSRLAWVVTGAQYQRNFFARDLAGIAQHLVPGRWWGDFGWGLVWLAAGAAAAAAARFRDLGPALIAFAAALLLGSLYAIPDDVGYWMPVLWLAASIAGVGAARLLASGAGPGVVRVALLLVALLGLGDAARRFPATYAAVDASKDLTPYLYATRNLAAVEPDALIVSEYDGRTFSLWFYKATQFRESHPKVVVAYKYLLIWPWYLHQLAHFYPWLRVPAYQNDLDDTMNRLIGRNVDQHPVYLTRLDPGLSRVFHAEPVGYPAIPLYRITRAKP
jgi:hypothetical protein